MAIIGTMGSFLQAQAVPITPIQQTEIAKTSVVANPCRCSELFINFCPKFNMTYSFEE